MTIAEYIACSAYKPTVALPCAPWTCDWIAMNIGVDPIEDMRDDWRERRILRMIADAGGFIPMTRERLAAAGLVETTDPQVGDVGIVNGGNGPALAVKTSTGWASRSAKGVTVAQFEMIAAWSLPCLL